MTKPTMELVEEFAGAVSLADDNANHGSSKYQDEYETIVGALRNEIRQRLEADAAELQRYKDEAAFALIRLNHETNQKKYFQEVLRQIGDLAHDRSTGPTVPDTLWEIRHLAYDAFKEQF